MTGSYSSLHTTMSTDLPVPETRVLAIASHVWISLTTYIPDQTDNAIRLATGEFVLIQPDPSPTKQNKDMSGTLWLYL
jgi:hypothetical protein